MRKIFITKKSMKGVNSYEAEALETTIRRAVRDKQPIEGASPIIFTEKKDGVKPEFNIRTDRFEIAQDAMGAVAATQIARRENGSKNNNEVKDQSADGTQE